MNLKSKGVCLILVGFFLFAGLLTGLCHAAEKAVKKVEIVGNKNTSQSVIVSKLKTRIGEPFSQNVVNEDLRRLYSLGFFSHISIDVVDFAGGVKVSFIVKEKPLVKEIVYKGNRHISEKKLKAKVTLKTGEILDEKKLKADEVAFKKLYEDKGYQSAEVVTEVNVDENTGQAIVYFRIEEHYKTQIRKIVFEGNQAFTDKILLKQLKTKTKGLFRSGILKEEVLAEDLEKLAYFYKMKGYLDVRVVEAARVTSEEGRWLTLTFKIDEGLQYKVNQIEIEGNLQFPAPEIEKLISIKAGNVYSPEALQKDLGAIRRFYFQRGYIELNVRGRTKVAEVPGTLNLVYDIVENGISHVEKIEIEGNSRTKDKVIRRELNLNPGEIFDGVKVERSQERLKNLGYFKEVDFNVEPTDQPGKKNLIVRVEEQKTGELGFGAGFSSIDDFIGFVDIRQNNFDIAGFPYFTGAGQKFRLRAEIGNKRRDFTASFTEPFLFDKRLAFGVDGFSQRREFFSTDYNEDRLGFSTRLGIPLGEFMRGDLKYTLERIDIFDVVDDASEFIKSQEGNQLVSRVGATITRDTRNSILLPSRGSRTSGTVEVAGLGGDTEFYKTYASSAVFFPVFEGHILMLKGQGGFSAGFGKTDVMPLFDRYFLGGANSIRGFKYRDVGPRDEKDEPIGGEAFIAGTVEYTFPLVPRLRGATFFDVGNVYLDRSDFDLGELSGAVGVGVRVNLPIGPVQIDYGFPVITDEFTDGEHGRFSFNLGTTF